MNTASNTAVTVEVFQRINSDPRLSLAGRAALVHMALQPAGYKPTVKDLVALTERSSRSSGRSVIYGVFMELRELGYLSRYHEGCALAYALHLKPINVAAGEVK
jgi:hypothetical protein